MTTRHLHLLKRKPAGAGRSHVESWPVAIATTNDAPRGR
jgi:hypothetical protein